jgi:hypothetical protein
MINPFGFCKFEVNPFGPVHEYAVAPVTVVAVKFTVPPTQIGPLLLAVIAQPHEFTVIVVFTVEGEPGQKDDVDDIVEVAENVYVPGEGGEAVTVAPDPVKNGEAAHVYMPLPPDAFKVTLSPGQMLKVEAATATGVETPLFAPIM